MQIHTPTVVQRGVDGPPFRFSYVAVFGNDLYLQWKAFDPLYKMSYLLRVVALQKGL